MAVIAYIALFVARAVIGNLTIALLKALRNYGLLVEERAGIEISDASQTRNAPGANAVAVLFILALTATILGCSLAPTTYISDAYGRTPINQYSASHYFAALGWVMMATDMIGSWCSSRFRSLYSKQRNRCISPQLRVHA